MLSGEWHVGRSWNVHVVEDECPCPQEPCGLVRMDRIDPSCTQHALNQTIRQSHPPDKCPALLHHEQEGEK